MKDNKLIRTYYDLDQKTSSQTNFYFLEHVLKARSDLHLETGKHEYDQEINVYIAGLLNSLIASTSFVQHKPYISAFDIDVRRWLDSHPGLRNEYVVYRDNADFGLVLLGLFLKYHHQGSYQHIVMPENNDQGRIALYYSLAASALAHLKGATVSLVTVYESIAEQMEEVLLILRRAAGTYFDLMEKISSGSMYHLEKELTDQSKKALYNKKIDEFLKLYSEYKENPTADLKKRISELSDELRLLDDKFSFCLNSDASE
jgi:hypothetical protein